MMVSASLVQTKGWQRSFQPSINVVMASIRSWTESKVPIWGIIPERVGIASGPESRLYREGLEAYDAVLKKALRKRPK